MVEAPDRKSKTKESKKPKKLKTNCTCILLGALRVMVNNFYVLTVKQILNVFCYRTKSTKSKLGTSFVNVITVTTHTNHFYMKNKNRKRNT